MDPKVPSAQHIFKTQDLLRVGAVFQQFLAIHIYIYTYTHTHSLSLSVYIYIYPLFRPYTSSIALLQYLINDGIILPKVFNFKPFRPIYLLLKVAIAYSFVEQTTIQSFLNSLTQQE